jgi:hypothetical protein
MTVSHHSEGNVVNVEQWWTIDDALIVSLI